MTKTVEELRKEIVQKGIMTEKEANCTKKGQLRKILENPFGIDESQKEETFYMEVDKNKKPSEEYGKYQFEDEPELNLEEDIVETGYNKKETEYVPEPDSLEWEPFIMSKFHESELDNGFPKIGGLRRLTKKYVGNIVFSGPSKVFPSVDEFSGGKASVLYEIKIQPNVIFGEACFTEEDLVNGNTPTKTITYRGLANAWSGNVAGDIYATHMEAIAETRAEARALKKALGINIVTAEEKSSNTTETGGEFLSGKSTEVNINEEGKATLSQINIIRQKCLQLKIDPEKLINKSFYEGKKEEKTYDDIKEVSFKIAKRIIQEINRYQSTTKDSIEIPEQIKYRGEYE